MESFFNAKIIDRRTQIVGDGQALFGSKYGQNEGIFAEWNWTGEKLTVTNDRYGFYPIYYACDEKSITVSPSITKLLELGASPEFDSDAFSVFLRQGWLIGEDTIFKSIRALPPSSILTWQQGVLEIRSTKITRPKSLDISRPNAIRRYAELFQRAVEKTLPDSHEFAVPISGGRDSRHILLALCKAERGPDVCLSVIHPPPRSNEDAQIAKQLCEALNIELRIVPQSRSRFASEFRKNELTGYEVDEHGWFLTLADYLTGKWDTVYDGIAGDVLSAGLFLNHKRLALFEQGKLEELADELIEPEGYLATLLTKELYRRFDREKAIVRVTADLSQHVDAPNPVGSFFFWNRTRRSVALSPFRLLNNLKVVTPYLEPDLFDFLSSLPASLMLDHQFHTDTIAFAYPEVSHIPYETKDLAPSSDFRDFRNFGRDILLYCFSKRNRTLINRSSLISRCMRSYVDKKYSKAITEVGKQALLLLQLERLESKKAYAVGRVRR